MIECLTSHFHMVTVTYIALFCKCITVQTVQSETKVSDIFIEPSTAHTNNEFLWVKHMQELRQIIFTVLAYEQGNAVPDCVQTASPSCLLYHIPLTIVQHIKRFQHFVLSGAPELFEIVSILLFSKQLFSLLLEISLMSLVDSSHVNKFL